MAGPDSPPALATTKRKFHKLLDNLTASTASASRASLYSSPTASTSSLARSGSPEPVAKRPRSSEAHLERQRQVSQGQARIQALKDQLLTPKPAAGAAVERKKTLRVVGAEGQQAPAATPRKAPNFQPYSQELFLGRLKSFADVKKWSSKPDAIGEVVWAKRGWSCDAWNTVACQGGCEKRVVVKLRPRRKADDGRGIDMTEDLASDVAPALVERYQALVIDGHDADCLWRKAGCQDDIDHIPIASRARSTADLLSRYAFLLAISADLPPAANITHPGPPIPLLLSRLPSTLFTAASLAPPATEPAQTAFALALFGWTGVSESRISLAVCNHCFQRLGLWLYTSDRMAAMSAKLDVPVASLRLDLLNSHREHCPWKNGAVQRNTPDGPTAGMPAWETLAFMLRSTPSRGSKDLPRLPHDAASAQMDGASHSIHERLDSVDLGSETTYPRNSADSMRDAPGYNDEGDEETLTNKWRKFKAKLKRSTSKRSLKSVRSVKSAKSSKSVWSARSGVENEGEE